jgi:hypothetical protein
MSRAKGAKSTRDSLKAKLAPIFHTSGKDFSDSVLPALVQLSKRERGIVEGLALRAELDEGDIAYLLQCEPDSQEVGSVMSKVKAARGEDEEKPARPRKARSMGKALGDF